MNASRQAIHSRIYFFTLSAICLLLPFLQVSVGFPFVSYLIAALILNWLVEMRFKEKAKSFYTNKIALLLSSLYLIYVLGLWNTSNMNEAGKQLITKMGLIVFPLIIFTSDRITLPKFFTLLRLFIYGCLAACMVLMAVATYHYATEHVNLFYYENLSKPLHFHPSYLSVYLIMAAFSALFIFMKQGKQLSWPEKILFGVTIAVFLFCLILLSARTQIAFLLLSVITGSIVFAARKKRYVLALSIPAALILALVASYFLFQMPRARTDKTVDEIRNLTRPIDKFHVTDRTQMWQTAVQLIPPNFLLGTGTGDVQDELQEQYRINEYTYAAKRNFNAHNQYFQTTLATGVVGLISLLLMLIVPMCLSAKQAAFLYIAFSALFAFSFMTESMLEAQSGTIFFALFNSLFALVFLQKANE